MKTQEIIKKLCNNPNKEIVLIACEKLAYLQDKINNLKKKR